MMLTISLSQMLGASDVGIAIVLGNVFLFVDIMEVHDEMYSKL